MGCNMKIAVFGSGSIGSPKLHNDLRQKAFDIGRLLAEKGATLITGGCGGLPQEAAKGAKSAGGHTVAYSPGTDMDEHKKFKYPIDNYDEFIYVPGHYSFSFGAALKYRNVISCNVSDACVIIGGRIGTMNEFTNMFDMGKVIGVLEGTGGVADYIKKIVEMANKDMGQTIIYDTDPKKLVDKIIKVIESGADR